MIRKTITQGLLIAASIVALWFALSQIDYMNWFGIRKSAVNTEEKLGELIWESIERTEKIIRNDSINAAIDSIVTRITKANKIDRKKIKVHVIRKSDVNAFAFPGNHLVVFTGLIDACENESELAGVIGHEIAHIRKKHVMKKLVREIGLATLIATAGGNGGTATGEILRTLTSSAYDRKLETEADLTSVDYLVKADIDPEPFAELMYRMSADIDLPEAVYWISSHPESEARAKEIISYMKDKDVEPRQILSDSKWKWLKNKVSDNY